MSIGVIDVVEWQTVVDFETGRKSNKHSEMIDMVKRILKNRNYPGDLDIKSVDWTVEMALELVNEYKPELMFMIFGTPFFHSAFRQIPKSQWQVIVDKVFD